MNDYAVTKELIAGAVIGVGLVGAAWFLLQLGNAIERWIRRRK